MAGDTTIKAIDRASVHRITSGQVVIDLQTAVKELLENSLDAGATSIEVRFRNHGLKSIEVVDNGLGIAEKDFEGIALKHHTSKLAVFEDLTTVRTFGFRGEALSSLCALCDGFTITTATQGPLGELIEMDRNGRIKRRSKVARQRGTTVQLSSIFAPLPVRRKEFERNAKREFGKALHLLNAYALGPCASSDGIPVKLTVSNQMDKGAKSVQIRTPGLPSYRSSVTALWGPRALDNVVDLDLSFDVERDKLSMRRLNPSGALTDLPPFHVTVKGLVSKFTVGAGRTGTDRQFFFVNGRPCDLTKVQKAFNEVYKSFNATQSAFLVADFIIPTEACDINVSPDKRTIFLHNEANLIFAFKAALETTFAPSRSMYDVSASQMTQTNLPLVFSQAKRTDSASSSGQSSSQPAPRTREASPNPTISPDTQRSSVRYTTCGRRATSRQPSSPAVADTRKRSISPEDLTAREEVGDAFFDEPRPASPTSSPSDDQSEIEVEHQEKSPDVDCPSAVARHIRAPPTMNDPIVSCPPLQPITSTTIESSSSPAGNMDVEVSVVGASWSQSCNMSPARAVSAVQEGVQRTRLEESDNDVDRPPLKKRRAERSPDGDEVDSDTLDEFRKAKDVRSVEGLWFSSQGHMQASTAEAVFPPHSPSKTTKASRALSQAKMRSQIAGFAMAGNQVPDIAENGDDEMEVDARDGPDNGEEDVDEYRGDDDEVDLGGQRMAGEDDAVVEAPRKRARRRRDLSVDTVDEEAHPAATFGSPCVKEESAVVPLVVDGLIDLTSEDESGPSTTADLTQVATSPGGEGKVVDEPEVRRQDSNSSGDVTIELAMDRIAAACERLRQALSAPRTDAEGPHSLADAFSVDAGLANIEDAESAASALARVIDKADFANMDIVGQFNRGFIIARRRKQANSGCPSMDDLFIVDQHASDERYNFETLQQTTKIESQRLLRPRPLELTAADELIALDHLDVLRQNGFEVEVGDLGHETDGARSRLVAQPVSKSTTFDMRDLEELIHLLQDAPSGTPVRCSKARAMFASRACRKSVMIGMPLTRGQMTSVVQHMGTLDQPWNCPHGRPTMRHLIDLLDVNSRAAVPRTINWPAISLSC